MGNQASHPNRTKVDVVEVLGSFLLIAAERAFHPIANARFLRINFGEEEVIPAEDAAEMRHVFTKRW